MFSKDRKIKPILLNLDENVYNDFDDLCKTKGYNKTAVLRLLVEQFINDKTKER